MRFGNMDGGEITWIDWQTYTSSPISWSLLPGDGTKTVCAQFRDSAGNLSPENDSCSHTLLDTTAPTTPSSGGPEGWTNNCTPTLTWSASTEGGSGLAGYYWKVDNGEETPTTSTSVTLMCQSDGTHTFYVRASDNAGNPSGWESRAFSLDTHPPTAKAGQSQTVNQSTPVTLDGSASSDNIGITSYDWSFGDGARGTGQTVTHSYAKPGTYTATVTVKDAAGNSDTASI